MNPFRPTLGDAWSRHHADRDAQRSQLLWLALALLALFLPLLATHQASEMVRDEWDDPGSPLAVAPHARTPLNSAPLLEGQSLLFEVCSQGGFDALQDADAQIWATSSEGERALVTEFEIAELPIREARGGHYACARVAQSDGLRESGTFSLELNRIDDRPIQPIMAGRIAAWRPLESTAAAAWILALGLWTLAWWGALRRVSSHLRGDLEGARASTPEAPSLLSPLLALLLLALALFGVGALPSNNVGAMWIGLSLAYLQIGLALTLSPKRAPSGEENPFDKTRPLRARLGFLLGEPRPTLRARFFPFIAVFVGVLAVLIGRMLLRWIPSTGVAPIETFLQMPSGIYVLAAVAMVAPLAEELFFRGYLYGVLQTRKGPLVAALLSMLAFVAVHLPQQWGAWGALSSVCVLSVLLTLLRARTGTPLPGLLAHWVHNACLVLPALL